MVEQSDIPVVDRRRRSVERRRSILLVEDDADLAALYGNALVQAGNAVIHARHGREALRLLKLGTPDLIVTDVMMPVMDGMRFLQEVRGDKSLRSIPVIVLTSRAAAEDMLDGYAVGADDYIAKPVKPAEFVARVNENFRPAKKLTAPRLEVAAQEVLSEEAFTAAIETAIQRRSPRNRPTALARFKIYEMEELRNKLGVNAVKLVSEYFQERLLTWRNPIEHVGAAEDGTFLVLAPLVRIAEFEQRLDRLCREIIHQRFDIDGEILHITPLSGYTIVGPGLGAESLLARSSLAVQAGTKSLDLRPVQFQLEMIRPTPKPRTGEWYSAIANALLERLRFPLQIVASYFIGLLLPFVIYVLLGKHGLFATEVVYWGAVIFMVSTCALIWVEGFYSLKEEHPPELPDSAFGNMSAIIAAYLPNEAATLESTIEAFLRLDYPADTQIILAYNTPVDMPIEERLRDLATADPRFVPLRVHGSTSKAENVNAGLAKVTGEVVGIYDADHQPDPDAFRRAWRWIADGADIVQGHCFIRNGNASWVAQTVAIEFEMIYSVSHPGRARVHDFGIFGGSNGFWRTDLLREIRMRGSMLTEDIDSAIRSVQAGRKIISDRHLISRELAPTTLKGFTNQRLRWAQGWFQVAMAQIGPSLKAEGMTRRQKIGMAHLLMWREVFPWLSLQIFPIIGYHYWRHGSFSGIDWLHPILIWLTLFVFLTGPGQVLFIWRNADPAMKVHKRWFRAYVWRSVLFFAGYKNLLARVANLKQIFGESAWKITPRD